MAVSKGLIARSAAGRPPGESRPLPLQPSPRGWPSPVVPTHQATRVAETCFRSDSKARSRQAARRSSTIEPAFCRLHSPPVDLAAPIPGITETKKGIAKRVPPRSDSSQLPIQPRHTTAAIAPTASCATRSPPASTYERNRSSIPLYQGQRFQQRRLGKKGNSRKHCRHHDELSGQVAVGTHILSHNIAAYRRGCAEKNKDRAQFRAAEP